MADALLALDGIGWVPQERGIFRSLTLEENLMVAARRGRWDLAAIYAVSMRCSRASTSGAATRTTSYRAANSRCCRSRAR
jgi:ABC-type branched-subunit amino acid transport system ATPase component